MGDYIEATGGKLANNQKTQLEKDVAARMVCTNNMAESPFATVRAFLHLYPSLTLKTVAGLSGAMVNGTHRGRGATKDTSAGIALTAPAPLRTAITKLCSVRVHRGDVMQPLTKKQSERIGTLGAITLFLRGVHEADRQETAANRRAHKQLKLDESARLQADRMAHFDKASETQLALTTHSLEDEILSYGTSKGALLLYLKEQYSARLLLRDGDYSSIPIESEYRMKTKPYKLRMEPHKPIAGTVTSGDKVNYLTALLKLMIAEDLTREEQPTVKAEETGLVRRLPVIAPQFANPLSLRLKRTQETDIAQIMAPTDNPWLTSLQAEWVGKILYDGGYFRVVQVQYVPNQCNNRYPCWEATSEPVYFNNGQYVVHDRNVSVGQNGRRVTLKSSLVGFALAEYSKGGDVDPVVLPHADECLAAFLKRKAPKPAAPNSTAPRHTKKRPHSATAQQELLSPTPRSSRRRTSGFGHST
jgi:hypothetical protein